MWPLLVSGGRFRELKQDRDDWKTKADALQAKYDKLMNQFVYRGTGVALDPELLPAAYRPKEKAPQNPLMDPAPEDSGPLTIRAKLRQVEEKRELAFQRGLGKIPAEVAEISKGA